MSNIERITTGIVDQLTESLKYIVELESTIDELASEGLIDDKIIYSLLPEENNFDYRKTLSLLKDHAELFIKPVDTKNESDTVYPEVKIDKFISIVEEIKDVYNSSKSNDEKHHIIFYEYMSIAQLHDADPFIMKDYYPVTSSNAGEILHLLNHVECKYNYLCEMKGSN